MVDFWFSQSKYEEGALNYDIPALCTALTEIIRICYSTEDERSPKQVLRLAVVDNRRSLSVTCLL
jgi:hypothetical protein